MYCGRRDDERARLDRDVSHARQPAVGVVCGGRHPDLGPGAVGGVAGERHPVLPADQPADPAQRCLGRLQVVAGADPMEEPLVVGWHQLAVLPDEALRPDQQQGVVEAARTLGFALVDADRDVNVVLGAGGGESVGEGAGHVHRVRPQPLPQFVEAVEGRRRLGPCPRRVQGHEGLGQHGELGAVGGGLADQADRLLHARLGVEDHGGRLDGCDPDGPELAHASILIAGPRLVADDHRRQARILDRLRRRRRAARRRAGQRLRAGRQPARRRRGGGAGHLGSDLAGDAR